MTIHQEISYNTQKTNRYGETSSGIPSAGHHDRRDHMYAEVLEQLDTGQRFPRIMSIPSPFVQRWIWTR